MCDSRTICPSAFRRLVWSVFAVPRQGQQAVVCRRGAGAMDGVNNLFEQRVNGKYKDY